MPCIFPQAGALREGGSRTQNQKKSFLVHFEAYDSLTRLTMEQRGILFTALLQYAMQETQEDCSPSEFLPRFPDMVPETRMAFQFLAANIRRETAAWQKKRDNYTRAAQRRNSRPQAAQSAPKPAGCEPEQDICWMGKYIRQRDAAHPPKDGSGPPRTCPPPDNPAGDEERPDR